MITVLQILPALRALPDGEAKTMVMSFVAERAVIEDASSANTGLPCPNCGGNLPRLRIFDSSTAGKARILIASEEDVKGIKALCSLLKMKAGNLPG